VFAETLSATFEIRIEGSPEISASAGNEASANGLAAFKHSCTRAAPLSEAIASSAGAGGLQARDKLVSSAPAGVLMPPIRARRLRRLTSSTWAKTGDLKLEIMGINCERSGGGTCI
jgi:hypothetical protein